LEVGIGRVVISNGNDNEGDGAEEADSASPYMQTFRCEGMVVADAAVGGSCDEPERKMEAIPLWILTAGLATPNATKAGGSRQIFIENPS
jgi:hypothetical protein